MATRLSDVAARAGVSVKTVSNVINDYPHITAQTRAKVEAAIAALDYTPNVSARSLRKGRSDFIALAIPEMASPYFAELGAAISRAAKRRGVTVLIDQTEGEAGAERLVLDGMRGQLIDGIIFSPITSVPARLSAAVTGKPLVLLGERPAGGQFDHVAVDSVQASYDATTHLISIGRRRIAAIGVGGGAGTGAVRRKGYRKALKAAGLPHDPALELAGTGYHRPDGADRCASCSHCRSRRTRCSASTICSPSAHCARWPTPGCACRTTWRWSASTTSRTAATTRHR